MWEDEEFRPVVPEASSAARAHYEWGTRHPVGLKPTVFSHLWSDPVRQNNTQNGSSVWRPFVRQTIHMNGYNFLRFEDSKAYLRNGVLQINTWIWAILSWDTS